MGREDAIQYGALVSPRYIEQYKKAVNLTIGKHDLGGVIERPLLARLRAKICGLQLAANSSRHSV